jgi:hypothetical protein
MKLRCVVVALALLIAAPVSAQDDRIKDLLRTIREALVELEEEVTPEPPPPPAQRTVRTSAELRTALTVSGSPIVIQPGTYVGNFVASVPNIVAGVQTAAGLRATPELVAGVKLVPADRTLPTLRITASDVTWSGTTIECPAYNRDAVNIGDAAATSTEAQPSRVQFLRNAVLGTTVGQYPGCHRGVSAHGSAITISGNHIAGITEPFRESQGIWVNNGPGPYTITDNYIEASGENILFGGDRMRIVNNVPSDILIAKNDLVKLEAWRTRVPQPVVKNILELKVARRVVIEDNTLDRNWAMAQDGTAVLFTVRNQEGDCTWCVVDDVTFRRNRVLNTPQGASINILGTDDTVGKPSLQTAKILIEFNLFRDARQGIRVNRAVSQDLTIRNNTFPAISHSLLMFVAPSHPVKTPLTYERNVGKSGSYGIYGDGVGIGLGVLTAYTVIRSFAGNVIEKTPERFIAWPGGTLLLEPGQLAPKLDANHKYLPGEAGY